MAEFWGLNIYEAMRDIALDEYQPPLTLYRKQPTKARKPRWHDICRNVYLVGDDDGDPWLVATDGAILVGMECRGSAYGILPIPKDALPPQGKKADASGWRFSIDGIAVKAARISQGYTGQVIEGETIEYTIPDTAAYPEGWDDFIMGATKIPKERTCLLSAEAQNIGRAFNALGARYDHWFYFPIAAGVGRHGKDIIAWSDDVEYKATARIAGRIVGGGDE